jgi:hypothetical protein
MPPDEFNAVKVAAAALAIADAERIEAAAAVLERRYPAARPDVLDTTISELHSIARAWRRMAASEIQSPAAGPATRDGSVALAAPVGQAQQRAGASGGEDGPMPAEPHMHLLETAWGVIANAGMYGQPKTRGWQEAAVRWRDDYHRWLDQHLRPGGYQTWEELAVGLTRERDALFFEVSQLQRAARDAAGALPVVAELDPGAEMSRLRSAAAGGAREVRRAIEEAVSAERERIRQMAIRNQAVCAGDEGTCCYFADLITEPSDA